MVPVACDNLTHEFLSEFGDPIHQADSLLIMTCAFGVQTIARQIKKMVIPALDTLFIGKETAVGQFDEICTQCGTCIHGLVMWGSTLTPGYARAMVQILSHSDMPPHHNGSDWTKSIHRRWRKAFTGHRV